MCARIRSPLTLERLLERFGFAPSFNFELNPNLAPTEFTPILRTSDEGHVWSLARFGLIPHWAKTTKGQPSLHNARAETVAEKPAFKQAYHKRRCIIPAEGFYEWREEQGKKIPYMISRKDGQLICFAGIWEYSEIDSEKIYSFSMVTGETTPLMEPYHDRMPFITDDLSQWMDTSRDSVKDFKPVPDNIFEIKRMNPAMNGSREKDFEVMQFGRPEKESSGLLL